MLPEQPPKHDAVHIANAKRTYVNKSQNYQGCDN